MIPDRDTPFQCKKEPSAPQARQNHSESVSFSNLYGSERHHSNSLYFWDSHSLPHHPSLLPSLFCSSVGQLTDNLWVLVAKPKTRYPFHIVSANLMTSLEKCTLTCICFSTWLFQVLVIINMSGDLMACSNTSYIFQIVFIIGQSIFKHYSWTVRFFI